jgi:formylglycine-generating enzyme required for sulfatase activity
MNCSPRRICEQTMPFDAFISYSSKDKIAADTCCAVLEKAGVRCWIAPRDVKPGSEYGTAIIDGIGQSRLMVLIFSSSANDSSQIRREIERAVSKSMPIIPVRIEEVTPTKSMEYFLGAIHWLDALTPPIEKHFQQLSETVKAILEVDASTGSTEHDETARKPPAQKRDRNTTMSNGSADLRNRAGALASPPSRPLLIAVPLVAAAVLLTAGIWFSLRQPAPTVVQAPSRSALKPKESFKDCDKCPEMVVMPAGSFTMGSPESERTPIAAAWANYGITPGTLTTNMPLSSEGPQHKATIAQPLAVGRFAVTFDQWDACVDDGGCNAYHPSDQGWGRGTRPVVNVSWDEAKAYVGWLSRRTAKNYRLLSEAEREYMTRAATTTPFWWGSTFSTDQANYNGTRTYNNQPVGENRQKTLPVDFFAPNPWGFYQVSGNSYDWVEDCIHDDYFGAPVDGSAWSADNCKGHVVRGGAWSSAPWNLRSAFRGWFPTNFRSSNHGLRVARPLAP